MDSTRRTCQVVSCRDVTSQMEFGLVCRFLRFRSFGGGFCRIATWKFDNLTTTYLCHLAESSSEGYATLNRATAKR